jgi:hypothetical protein
MNLPADQAGDRLVAVGVVRDLFGDKALNLVPGVRAAIEERRHKAPKSDGRVGANKGSARPPVPSPPLGGTLVVYPAEPLAGLILIKKPGRAPHTATREVKKRRRKAGDAAANAIAATATAYGG